MIFTKKELAKRIRIRIAKEDFEEELSEYKRLRTPIKRGWFFNTYPRSLPDYCQPPIRRIFIPDDDVIKSYATISELKLLKKKL